jgi:hypothetical protein
MPRYTTSGIPPSQARLGLSAFMPHYNRLAASGAQAYKGSVTGRPGTTAIPVSGITTPVPSPDLGDIAQMGLSRSSDAPNAFWPNQYYTNPVAETGGIRGQAFWPGAGMPVQMYNPVRPQDTTMIPVPATDLRGVYQARSATLAGGVDNNCSRALKQAAAFIRWPRRHSGNGSNQ